MGLFSGTQAGIEASEEPTKQDTKIQVKLQNIRKAGLAKHSESRKPKPPNRKGNVVGLGGI